MADARGLTVTLRLGAKTAPSSLLPARDAEFSASGTVITFRGFLAAYEEIIRKVRANKLTADDFQGANITLTNPGTIGTVQSVPRLMPGQGVIVGVGSIDYPAEFEGADRANLSSLGISKVALGWPLLGVSVVGIGALLAAGRTPLTPEDLAALEVRSRPSDPAGTPVA